MNRSRINRLRVVELYSTGISCKETAAALGISERQCFRILTAANVSRTCKAARRLKFPGIEDKWEEVKRLYTLGYSSAEVSKQVDYAPGDVRRICKALGISRSKSEAASNKPISPKGYRRKRVAGKLLLIHRLVAGEKIGRALKSNEVAHHKNEVRTDNRKENLEVMSKPAHTRLHNFKRWKH